MLISPGACSHTAGIAFTSQNETPGLGARIEERWFVEQFRGKRAPLKIRPEKEKTSISEFEAITGATVTTNAVKAIVNGAAADAAGVVGDPDGER